MPAAFLGSGRRFSGGLSRIEPRFSVIRQRHGWHSTNRRQHDRSETRRWRRRLEAVRSAAITRVSSTGGRPFDRPTGFRLISAPFPDAPKRAESEPRRMY